MRCAFDVYKKMINEFVMQLKCNIVIPRMNGGLHIRHILDFFTYKFNT